MSKISTSLLFALFFTLQLFAQQHTLHGYVKDSLTGEVLIGAAVYTTKTFEGTITNEFGYYSLTLPKGVNAITVSYIGYKAKKLTIHLEKEVFKDFKLHASVNEIEQVVVQASASKNPLKINEFDVEVLTPKSIENIPVAFGEGDVVKAIQLMPSVTALGEGSSGLFVQGGGSDQNLMLIDGVPVYNPSHLFGLVSVFNPDALKNVEFYKGAMPARFGGKVSSVINSQMIDGNKYEHKFSGGIGTMTAHLAANGPLVKEKASYLIAARRSIRDLFQNPSNEWVSYVPQFYDINLKTNWALNDQNNLVLSVYNGKDNIKTDGDYNNKWGNTTLSTRWNHIWNSKLFMNVSANYSNYYNEMVFKAEAKDYRWLTGLEDIFLKTNFTWTITPKNKIRFGAESAWHKYIPGESDSANQSLFRVNALENAFYLLHDVDVFDWLGINYGLRYSLFQNTGEAQWHEYDGNNAVGIAENTKGVYKSYSNLEPRATINFKLNANHVVKVGYAKTAQYARVLQNSIFSYTSIQTWMPCNPNIAPLSAHIYSAGYFGQHRNTTFSLEGYYKSLNKVIDYIEHAQLINYPYVESQVRAGEAEAYGVSVQLKHTEPKYEIDASYTYAQVLNTIPEINQGETYPALHNIPHDIRIRGTYRPFRRFAVSAFWTYHSGYVLTLPLSVVPYNSQNSNGIPIYTSRNGGRFPPYHRLDLSFYLYPKNTEKFRGTWSAGVYNAYYRLNPVGVSVSEGYNNTYYVYTFFRMIPYISYNFKF